MDLDRFSFSLRAENIACCVSGTITSHSRALSSKVRLNGPEGSWENKRFGTTTFLLWMGFKERGPEKKSRPGKHAWLLPAGSGLVRPTLEVQFVLHHFPSMLITAGSALCQRECSHLVLNDSQLLSEAGLPQNHMGRCCVGMTFIRGLNILGVVVTAWVGSRPFLPSRSCRLEVLHDGCGPGAQLRFYGGGVLKVPRGYRSTLSGSCSAFLPPSPGGSLLLPSHPTSQPSSE